MQTGTVAFALFAAAAIMTGASQASGQTLQEKVRRDQTITIPRGDPEMAAAMQKARSTLSEFLALADAPKASTSLFAVKVGIPAKGNVVEYFWIGPFTRENGRFSGKIDNEPRSVEGLRLGDRITFDQDQIVDWLYLEDGRMKGNFTACVLFKRERREEAEAMIAKYRMDCKL